MEAHGVGSDKHFWRDNRVWVPLADLCLTLAPDLCAPWPNWFLNQSFGLTADQAAKLADRLEELITNGSVQKYMDEAPEYEVSLANASRREAALADLLDRQTAKGNPLANEQITDLLGRLIYQLDPGELVLGDLREWTTFLEECGGFVVWDT